MQNDPFLPRKEEVLRGFCKPIFQKGATFQTREQAKICLLESNEIEAKMVKQRSKNAIYFSYKCVNELCSYQSVASSKNNDPFICRKFNIHNCILGDYGDKSKEKTSNYTADLMGNVIYPLLLKNVRMTN